MTGLNAQIKGGDLPSNETVPWYDRNYLGVCYCGNRSLIQHSFTVIYTPSFMESELSNFVSIKVGSQSWNIVSFYGSGCIPIILDIGFKCCIPLLDHFNTDFRRKEF